MMYKYSYYFIGQQKYTNRYIPNSIGVYLAKVTQIVEDDEILYYCNKKNIFEEIDKMDINNMDNNFSTDSNDWVNCRNKQIYTIITHHEIETIFK